MLSVSCSRLLRLSGGVGMLYGFSLSVGVGRDCGRFMEPSWVAVASDCHFECSVWMLI